jgi:hypothetical protein
MTATPLLTPVRPEVPNRRKDGTLLGKWIGPVITPAALTDLVCASWPMRWWLLGVAIPLAEASLEASYTDERGARQRSLVVWTRTEGDLHLVDDQHGPSIGVMQLRQPARRPRSDWPFGLDQQLRGALSLLNTPRGVRHWGCWNDGRIRAHLPRAHAELAAWWSRNPTHPNKELQP